MVASDSAYGGLSGDEASERDCVASKEEARKEVTKAIKEWCEEAGYFPARVGWSTTDATLSDRVDFKTGFWNDRQWSGDPTHWLLHILPDEDGIDVQSARGERHIAGGIQTGNLKRICVVLRAVPLVRLNDSRFVRPPSWEWLVLLIFREPIPPVSTSAGLRIEDFSQSLVRVDGETLKYSDCSLITLPGRDAFEHSELDERVSYDEVTKRLRSLLSEGWEEPPNG